MKDLDNKAIFNMIIFTLFLAAAIFVGNTFLSYVMHRPIDEVPAVLKVIVHGVTLVIFFNLARKYFGNR